MEFTNRIPTPEAFNRLRLASGISRIPHDPDRVARAMEGSSFICSVWEGEELIGFGRVIDDGGICYSVNDIMVDKRYQRQGIGDRILSEIDGYLADHAYENSFVTLIAKRPADHLYHRHRFEYLADERRCGMIRNQKDRPTEHFSPI